MLSQLPAPEPDYGIIHALLAPFAGFFQGLAGFAAFLACLGAVILFVAGTVLRYDITPTGRPPLAALAAWWALGLGAVVTVIVGLALSHWAPAITIAITIGILLALRILIHVVSQRRY